MFAGGVITGLLLGLFSSYLWIKQLKAREGFPDVYRQELSGEGFEGSLVTLKRRLAVLEYRLQKLEARPLNENRAVAGLWQDGNSYAKDWPPALSARKKKQEDVAVLRARGLEIGEIARQVELKPGEVELMLSLQKNFARLEHLAKGEVAHAGTLSGPGGHAGAAGTPGADQQ